MRALLKGICAIFILSVFNINPVLSAQVYSLDELSIAVVLLYREDVKTVNQDGVEHEVWLKAPDKDMPEPLKAKRSGTGYFIVKNNQMYLVTAAHVALIMAPNNKAVLRGKEDTPITLSLSELSGYKDKLSWSFHEVADIAVLPLNPTKEIIQQHLTNRFLPFEVLVPDLRTPERETPLTVVGFPKGLGVEGHFSPLTLQSYASSGLLSMKRFDTHKISTLFLLQDPSVGGYSGAPVFDLGRYKWGGAIATTGTGTLCFGIMHGTISDDTGGKLSAVTPSKFIIETLEKSEKERK